jgi:endonuclease/exonuclease/phosphatase family metal-dependent hydrolase
LFQKIIFTTYFFFCCSAITLSQNYSVSCIGFYNVENLFDIKDDKNVNDVDFTPNGKNLWNAERYQKKINDISEVIKKIGTDVSSDGLAILGLSEVENRGVLEDLIANKKISQKKYKIVHADSPDRRGIDVALIYQPSYFELTSSKSFELKLENDTSFRSRSQLLVSGNLLGERVHIIVAHWPSRSGGEKRSSPKRIAASKLGRSIIDSIQLAEPNAKVIYMGDLNDDPTNNSLTKHMLSNGNRKALKSKNMFNPMLEMYKKGIGSLAWRDTWNIFDQILLSPSLIKENVKGWKFYNAKVYNKQFLIQTDGPYKGYPFRTYAGGNYKGGYSDHFPVYIYLIKEQ